MRLRYAMHRSVCFAGAVVVAAAAWACSSSEEPSTIVSMTVTVGDETVTMDADGTVTGTVTVTVSGGEALDAAFFDESGGSVSLSGTDFTLAVAPADTDRLDYEPLSPFTGVLGGLIAGPTTMDVGVLETASGAVVFGPFEVSVTVQ